MPKVRVYVSLDDDNTKAVNIIMGNLNVSASRAVNILIAEGLKHNRLVVAALNRTGEQTQAVRARRVAR